MVINLVISLAPPIIGCKSYYYILQSGRLAIHWACSGGRANIVQFILDSDGRLADAQDDVLTDLSC